jgi:hypothetical protein
VVALLGMFGPIGCHGCSDQGPLLVRKVLIDVDPAAEAAGVDREQVRAMVRQLVERARGVRTVEAGQSDGAVLRVTIENYARTTGEQESQSVSLGIEVTGAREEGRRDASYRGHSVASAQGDIGAPVLFQQALRDALAQVLSTRGATHLSSRQLISWLSDSNATDEQRRRAIRILGTRRERDAVAGLDPILLGQDKDLAQLALVAVTNIGDPQSVPAVIRFAEGQPPIVRKQAIDAVRAIGTREGKAWLFTLSTGHPDPEVQQQAAAALVALEGPSAPDGPAVADSQSPAQRTDGAADKTP